MQLFSKYPVGLSINFIFRVSPIDEDKSNEKNPLGYVYVQRIENRKTSYRSLRLPKFRREFWDEHKQRVKRNQKIEHEWYNAKIEKTLKDILDKRGSLRGIDEANDGRSFLAYFKSVLDGVKLRDKHGTRTKYNTVYQKLLGFLEFKDKTDLLFSELDVDLIDEIQYYMLSTGMHKNTVTHYLKILQTVVRKSMVNRNIQNTYNPFVNFEFEKKSIITKETLEEGEVKQLLKLQVKDLRLKKIKNMFLFQFFVGGMRVSDLVTLRFRNLINGRLEYRMLKTDYPMDMPLTSLLVDLISRSTELRADIESYHTSNWDCPNLSERKEEFLAKIAIEDSQSRPSPFAKKHQVLESMKIPAFVFLEKSDFERLPYLASYVRLSRAENLVNSMPYSILNLQRKRVISYLESKGMDIQHKSRGLQVSWIDSLFREKKKYVETFLELLEKRIEKVRMSFYQDVLDELTELGTNEKTKNKFVFQRLKEEDFESVIDDDNFNKATEIQYKKINRAGIVYNRNLKEIETISGINKRFHSHLPRISFTNLMMKEKQNPRDISDILGHASLATTAAYTKSGFKDGRVDSVINKTSSEYE